MLGALCQIKSTRLILEQDGKVNLNVRSLNEKQRGIFRIVLTLLV